MTTSGRFLLDELQKIHPDEPFDSVTVNRAIDDLDEQNKRRMDEVVQALQQKGKNKWVSGLNGAWKNDEQLFNSYFSNKCFASEINPVFPKDIDVCRSAVLFFLAVELQAFLIAEIRKLPTSSVFQAQGYRHQEQYSRISRFMQLQQIALKMSTVQFDIEQFHDWAILFLDGKPANGGRRTYWPYDAEVMHASILLGFQPTGKADSINSVMMTSHVVAAGALRSHLEAVLFQIDFRSSLDRNAPLSEDSWKEALKVHADAGDISKDQQSWATVTYGLLSMSLHAGLSLSSGELWAMGRVVKSVEASLREAKKVIESK